MSSFHVSKDVRLTAMSVSETETIPKIDTTKAAPLEGNIAINASDKLMYYADGVKWNQLYGQGANGTFDVIICGCGTAGAIAAKRISDNTALSVLVLEQGVDNNNYNTCQHPFEADTPLGAIGLSTAIQDPRSCEILNTANYTGGLFAGNLVKGTFLDTQVLSARVGMGWGGSSNHNFLLGVRPSPAFQNYISTFAGAFSASWNSASTTTIYKNIENYVNGVPAEPERGYSGPLVITQNNPPVDPSGTITKIQNSFISQSNSAVDNLAVITGDYNNDVDVAFVTAVQQFLHADVSPTNLERSSTAQAFLGPTVVTPVTGAAIAPRKLRIISNAVVNRIIFTGTTATGVEAVFNGQYINFTATKKIIISAGSLRSSGILERSGVGSAALMASLGITPVYVNENVGANLSVHTGPAYAFTVNPAEFAAASFVNLMDLNAFAPNTPRQVENILNSNPAIGYMPPNGFLQSLGIPLDFASTYRGFGLMVQPTARSTNHIIDRVPGSRPKLILNIDSTAIDIFTVRENYQLLKRIETDLTANFASMAFTLRYPPASAFAGYPGPPSNVFTASISGTTLTVTLVSSGALAVGQTILGGAVWSSIPEATILQGTQILKQLTGAAGSTGTYQLSKSQTVGSMQMHSDFLEMYAAGWNIVNDHWCGPCTMGDLVTQNGVVDGQLHVYGVQKLMVADNSIWTAPPDCNTTLAAALVGWRAADICLATI